MDFSKQEVQMDSKCIKMFNILSYQENANQNVIDSSSTQSEWLSSRRANNKS
jgi:hypothetical protein